VYGLPEEVSDERRLYLNPIYSTKPQKCCSIYKKNYGMMNPPNNGGSADEKVTIHRRAIILALNQKGMWTSVPDVCHRLGISDTSFCTWRKK